MYTAAVLQPNSVELLKNITQTHLNLEDFRYETPEKEPLPHHMTINLGIFDEKINNLEILNQPVKITIDSIWCCKTIGACAARVSNAVFEEKEIKSINKNKHITICLKPPAKPVDSNKIFNGGRLVILKDQITLDAKVQIVGLCDQHMWVGDGTESIEKCGRCGITPNQFKRLKDYKK